MEQQQKACVCLGTHSFQRQLTLLTGTNTQCWWILGFITVLTQNAHTPKKHDSRSATSSSSWIRIVPLQSIPVSPSEVIFYLEACKKIKMKMVADSSCRGSPFQKWTESISHLSSVACNSPSYRTESGFWSSNVLCPSYHNDNLQVQKGKLNFDRNRLKPEVC